jgi:NIPSNAP
MFYEIRRYQTRPGRREEWVRYMEDVVIPYEQSRGMVVTASFVDDEDPDGYVWIRRFDDETHRAAAYAATHDDAQWTDHIFPAIRELLVLDRTVVTRAVPTQASPLR